MCVCVCVCVCACVQSSHTTYPSPVEIMTAVNLVPKDAKEGTIPAAKLKVSTLMERPSSMKKCG